MSAAICFVVGIVVEVGVNNVNFLNNMSMEKEMPANIVSYNNYHEKQGYDFPYICRTKHGRKDIIKTDKHKKMFIKNKILLSLIF